MSVYIENEINAIFDFDCCKVIRQVAEESLRYVNCPYKAEINVVITDSAGI